MDNDGDEELSGEFFALSSETGNLEVPRSFCSIAGPNVRNYISGVLVILLLCFIHVLVIVKYSFGIIKIVIAIVLYLGFIALTKILNSCNPGVIARDLDLSEYLESAEPAKIALINGIRIIQHWCPQCRIYKEPRSRHCYECNFCIKRYDHHCPMLSNCIGKYNYKLFVLFVLYSEYVFNYSVYVIISAMMEGWPQNYSFFEIKLYAFIIREQTELVIYMIPYAALSMFFTYYFAVNKYLILFNLTTYEYLTRAYPDVNPFNEGIARNIINFFKGPLFSTAA